MGPVRCIFLNVFVIVALTLACTPVAAASSQEASSQASDIPALISALSDPDLAVRQHAAEQLVNIGMPARPQILKAARSDNPEQRAQAAKILGRLPWWRSDDPQGARHLLVAYGQADQPSRIAIIEQLDRMNATSTLMRLFNEEPADSVRWMIVLTWIQRSDAGTFKTLRGVKPADDDAPAQFLAGYVWMDADRARTIRHFRRAIELDAAAPTNDSGILTEAFDFLASEALETQDYDQAATWLRRLVPRELGQPHRSARAIEKLAALQQYFGPLRHYAWDVQTWSLHTEHPSLLTAMCIALEPLGFTPPLPTDLTSSFKFPFQHARVGEFLYVNRLFDPAELELRRSLVHASRRSNLSDARPLALLGMIASARDDDAAAADFLDRALALKGQTTLDIGQHMREQDLRAELYFRRARIAQAAGDVPHADHLVDQLLDFAPSNTDAVIKIIVWLKQTSRAPQAKTLFARVYEQAEAELAEASNDRPTRCNDLAWFCARCGENLDEAVKLAQSAVDASPDNAAFLDTIAEAKYRTGHAAEAIRLETRALQLSPDKTFMKKQIERFKAGKP